MGVISYFSYYDPNLNTPSIYTNVTKFLPYIHVAMRRGKDMAVEKKKRMKQHLNSNIIYNILR